MPPTESSSCAKCGAELLSPEAECANCLLELGFSTVIGSESGQESNTDFTSRVFGDYELLDEIARGGMGVVYRARQRSLDRIVALKLILGGQMATKEFVRRFRSEAAAAAALQHSHIVSIHDVGVHGGNHFFSMDYVEGQNLAQLVGNHPLSAEKAARYMKAIAEAIQHAHDQGILHRDLKPSNILVDAATDQPRVTDFGLAKKIDQESSLTLSGQILGSPHFMPPEQADSNHGKVGRTSDVYGLGAILYFLLTARPPFQGDNLQATLNQVINTEPVSPHLLSPTVPRDLETICLKCLNKEPARRYPTAKAMGEDVARFLDGEPIHARPTTRAERTWRWCRRNRAVAALLSIALILILTLAIGAPIAAFRIKENLQDAKAHLYAADMNTVQTALVDADLVLARELLDRHRPTVGETDQRGFEWRYLWNLSQGDEEYVLEPQISWPRRVLFSHNGKMLAAGGWHSGASVVWNMNTKAVEQYLPDGDRPVVFHSDAPQLFTAGPNGLKVWNTDNWDEQKIGDCAGNAIAKLSPDHRWLVVFGNDLQVWNTQNWTLVSSNQFSGISHYSASTFAISRDSTIVSCGEGFPFASAARLNVFELPSLEPVAWSSQLPDDVSSAAFHPEQDLMVTGDWSGDIELWDSSTGEPIRSNMKQSARIMAITFNPDDPNVLATTGGDRSIRLWHLDTQKEFRRLHGADDELEELAYSPNGQTIATGGHGTPITLWNAAKSKADSITIETEHRSEVLGFSGDQQRVLTIDITGQLMYRDAESFDVLEPLFQVELNPGRYKSLKGIQKDVSPDMKSFALGSTNGTVGVWDLEMQTSIELQAHTNAVRELAFSPDSRELVSVGQDKEVHLWDLSTMKSLASTRLEQMSGAVWNVRVRFSPNEEFIAVAAGGQLSILGRKDLELLLTIHKQNNWVSLRFSPDGRYLAAGQQGPTIKVWDTENWDEPPRLLRGHQMIPYDITFSPDGRRMVTGSDRLVIWDTDTWQRLSRYKLPITAITGIWFSPDGNDLITADPEAIRVWRAPSLEEIEERETQRGRWQ